MIFSAADFNDHERVLFFCDSSVGLRAIVAIHDTTLGPAVGGARMLPYPNEADALADVLRLSRGMTFADIDTGAAEAVAAAFGARAVDAATIHAADVDVYAPCARGGVLNDRTIPELRASIVAGAANNQLAEDRHGAALVERGILYAPDYAINAGGIINGHGAHGYSENHLFTFTKNTLCGCESNSAPTSLLRENPLRCETKSCRACCHTRNAVEPGWNSQRTTKLELKSRKPKLGSSNV